MLADVISEIIAKYDKEEAFLDQQLQEKFIADEHKNVSQTKQVENLSVSAAKQRNKELLKELELVKGKLRSKSIYSPIEINWDAICERYQEAPALPILLWKCHTYK